LINNELIYVILKKKIILFYFKVFHIYLNPVRMDEPRIIGKKDWEQMFEQHKDSCRQTVRESESESERGREAERKRERVKEKYMDSKIDR
jgi:hypothetical protein